jgi:SAM-dependent methyltransferase
MTERIQRLVFGEVAEDYDRNRPSYPDALIDLVMEIAGLQSQDPVVESGAGTGKATRLLAARGLQVTAVEPDPAMAAVARRNVPDARFVVSSFDEAPLPPRHFAAVVAAQSWHWVDADLGPRKAAEVLRPGGWITLIWNRPDLDACEWHDDLQPIYRRIAPGMEHEVLKSFSNSLPRAVDHLDRDGWFETPIQRLVPWVARYTSAEYIEFLNTHSDKRMLPDSQRAELFAAIRESLDAAGGIIEHPYVAELVAAPALDRSDIR